MNDFTDAPLGRLMIAPPTGPPASPATAMPHMAEATAIAVAPRGVDVDAEGVAGLGDIEFNLKFDFLDGF